MYKFNKIFKVGTKVLLGADLGWTTIKEINDARVNIKVEKFSGSFQRYDVLKFTNK